MPTGTPNQRATAETFEDGRRPNFSSAVSAQRFESGDSLDDFPTPPWGARAWVEHVIGREHAAVSTCWEPAANRGFLVRGLRDFFLEVAASDVHDYGAGYPIHDFLSDAPFAPFARAPDWIVTNPPFNKLLPFTLRALERAQVGVGIFCRLQALEGLERYRKIYSPNADRYCFSQFVERISLVKGTVDPSAGRPAAYGWLTIWKEPKPAEFLLARRHIGPCRRACERAGDYEHRTGVFA